jgi:type I restriction enzyme R subunit
LPFCYQSTGVETHFTNGFDPDPRSRNLFAFHRPDTLASWLQTSPPAVSGSSRDGQESYGRPATFRRLLKTLPPLIEQGLWAAQIRAIGRLEESLAEDRPRALIQMATGSGKTFTAINFIYPMD